MSHIETPMSRDHDSHICMNQETMSPDMPRMVLKMFVINLFKTIVLGMPEISMFKTVQT